MKKRVDEAEIANITFILARKIPHDSMHRCYFLLAVSGAEFRSASYPGTIRADLRHVGGAKYGVDHWLVQQNCCGIILINVTFLTAQKSSWTLWCRPVRFLQDVRGSVAVSLHRLSFRFICLLTLMLYYYCLSGPAFARVACSLSLGGVA